LQALKVGIARYPDGLVNCRLLRSLCRVDALLVEPPLSKLDDQEFLLAVYKDDAGGRRAEIYWKLMYATLGLALTSLNYFEVVSFKIRDSFLLWSVFYTAAAVKIRIEAVRLDIIAENRLFIQLWHSFVAVTMAAARESLLLVHIWNMTIGRLPLF
jgi:hypothetical protein